MNREALREAAAIAAYDDAFVMKGGMKGRMNFEGRAAVARRGRRRGLPVDDRSHGTVNGYENYGCRCDRCREASRAYRSARRSGSSGKSTSTDATPLKNPTQAGGVDPTDLVGSPGLAMTSGHQHSAGADSLEVGRTVGEPPALTSSGATPEDPA